MLYLYDEAIVADLSRSFNPRNISDPKVKVVKPENVFAIAAQLNDDKITFPLVCIFRDSDYGVDYDRWNFTRVHKGIPVVIDTTSNNIYYERALPVHLSYTLTVLTTNQEDMDEIERELIFKYSEMYFLSIELPYESHRKIRFGVTLDKNKEIERSSGNEEYADAGRLFQIQIPLKCEGCIEVTNIARKLIRTEFDVDS